MRRSQCYSSAVLSLVVLSCFLTAAVGQESNELLAKQAKQKISAFSGDLKQALIEAIQSKGFSHALNVCKIEAPKIAQQLSTDDWEVARTSLRVRNSANQADSWETQMLNSFDSAFKAGSPVTELSATSQDDATYRYMQAIPMGQVCLACHGKQVEPRLLDTIKMNYPQDTATGFTLEDIRGAFTLSKALDN